MRRAWINQPSTLQSCHHWHGERVLTADKPSGATAQVWFARNTPLISAEVPVNALSAGWPADKEVK